VVDIYTQLTSYGQFDDPLYLYLKNSYGVAESVFVDENLAYFGKYKGSDEIVVDSVIPYDRFKLLKSREIIYLGLLERQSEISENTSRSSVGRGVIPTIQIPVYMPPSFSFLGKEGAKIDIDGTQSVNLRFEKKYNS